MGRHDEKVAFKLALNLDRLFVLISCLLNHPLLELHKSFYEQRSIFQTLWKPDCCLIFCFPS